MKEEAFAMWLACETQEVIAERVGWSQQKVAEFTSHGHLAICGKPGTPEYTRAHHAEEAFNPPLYNIWKQQTKSEGSGHFGNSEVRWVDNLLYLYTKPFDVVVDPFAGGGSTIDICQKRFRRYWVSDRKPIVERTPVHTFVHGMFLTSPCESVKVPKIENCVQSPPRETGGGFLRLKKSP